MNERVALTRLRNGDLESLGDLVNKYQLKAIRAAYLITQDRGMAEDVVQAVFLQLPQKVQRFDMTRPFEPWFMKCVINDAIKAAQRRSKWSSLDIETDDAALIDLVADSALTPEDQVEAADIENILRQALLKLPAHQRAVMVMRYYLDMTEQEISEEIEIAPGTVKSRLSRARTQLSGWLKTNLLSMD
jgi:RNA polymerase sigma-70 factor, ECF subfamily